MTNMMLYKIIAMTPNMCISNNVYVQLPEIELTYTSINLKEINEGGWNTKQSISLTMSPKDIKHLKAANIIDKIEEEIRESFVNCKDLQRKELLKSLKKYYDYDSDDDNDDSDDDSENFPRKISYYLLKNIKVANNTDLVYLKGNEHIKYTFEEAVKLGFLGKGSRVKALIKLIEVWDCGPYHTRRYLKWGIDQMLILRESDENVTKKKGCPIVDDDE